MQLGQCHYTLYGTFIKNLCALMSLYRDGTESSAICAYLKIRTLNVC